MTDQRNGGIAWTDETWNPLRGCSRASEGCRNCYAESMAGRFCGPGQPFEGVAKRVDGKGLWTGDVKLIEAKLTDPLRWRRPRRIFVNSVSDLFHPSVPDEWIDSIFAVMALCPQHTFQVLTKRPERMREYCSNHGSSKRIRQCTDMVGRSWPLSNVWLGVSVENQAAADERIPHLLATPAALRFLSCEPMLGPVDLGNIGVDGWGVDALKGLYFSDREKDVRPINWIIVGGESGPNARPMHPDWARSLRDQCAAADTPFMLKQWGEWAPAEVEHQDNGTAQICYLDHNPDADVEGNPCKWQFFEGETFAKVGKRIAGHRLDGVEHMAFPEVSP